MGVWLVPQTGDYKASWESDSESGYRTGWGLSRGRRGWYGSPSIQSSRKGHRSQTHKTLLGTYWLYPLKIKKTWEKRRNKKLLKNYLIFKTFLNIIYFLSGWNMNFMLSSLEYFAQKKRCVLEDWKDLPLFSRGWKYDLIERGIMSWCM